jgi:hypothetical protein
MSGILPGGASEKIGRNDQVSTVDFLEQRFGLRQRFDLLGRGQASANQASVFHIRGGEASAAARHDDDPPRARQRPVGRHALATLGQAIGEIALRAKISGQCPLLNIGRHCVPRSNGPVPTQQSHDRRCQQQQRPVRWKPVSGPRLAGLSYTKWQMSIQFHLPDRSTSPFLSLTAVKEGPLGGRHTEAALHCVP